MPMTVMIGISALRSACLPMVRHSRQPLGARGADVILAQHLEHRRAGDAGEQADLEQRQDQRRQRRSSAEPRPQPLRDRRIAARGSHPS